MRGQVFIAAAWAFALAACATTPPQGLPPVTVTALAETVPVGTANQDAADDPAIWRNTANPQASLIVATDKKAGLYVYGLDGQVKSFTNSGLVNNVDVVDLGQSGGAQGVIVVASDRNDLTQAVLQVYRLNTATATLEPLANGPGGAGEGYGLCLGYRDGVLRAYSVLKEGRTHEVRIDLAGATPQFTMERTLTVASQPEGCVVDNRNGTLYVGEETRGLWRFAAGTSAGELVAPIDNQYLVADLEGLALAPSGTDGGYLVASSQGDNAYAVFALPGVTPVGRFRIAAGTLGATEETDGIDLVLGDFGPLYPQGLFVAQDGHNAPAAQNFKLVSWQAVAEALGLAE
ncbi:phytase [Alteraurantiacibacter buctensis]|uniref:Phytase n=1 Tax=Alteraurantiacibacter buctensis TaxID=1503981 RepID=A0A844Z0X5_9SPHN|nr:phytase [Alteraurantiacibacter buctensis]MXO71563.1 phytase [Alteraurantiacibacter buctensis]